MRNACAPAPGLTPGPGKPPRTTGHQGHRAQRPLPPRCRLRRSGRLGSEWWRALRRCSLPWCAGAARRARTLRPQPGSSAASDSSPPAAAAWDPPPALGAAARLSLACSVSAISRGALPRRDTRPRPARPARPCLLSLSPRLPPPTRPPRSSPGAPGAVRPAPGLRRPGQPQHQAAQERGSRAPPRHPRVQRAHPDRPGARAGPGPAAPRILAASQPGCRPARGGALSRLDGSQLTRTHALRGP